MAGIIQGKIMKACEAYAIFTLLILTCCNGEIMSGDRTTIHSLDKIPASLWEALAQKRVFFGHQSVGDNIIQGMNELMDEHNVLRINIERTKRLACFEKGVFAHFSIGKNENPAAKIQDFEQILRSGIGEKADIAFFKFCFVDIASGTDIQKVFSDYARTMGSLKTAYPRVIFVHVTVPLLRKEKSSPKAWLRKLLGKADGFFANEHNVQRNEYNQLIMKKYAGKEPIFDLAGVESTYPDGTRQTFAEGGKTYYSLVPEYTEDGGHLNELGRKRVAEQFLIFLARIQ